jgi:hypothetical protein
MSMPLHYTLHRITHRHRASRQRRAAATTVLAATLLLTATLPAQAAAAGEPQPTTHLATVAVTFTAQGADIDGPTELTRRTITFHVVDSDVAAHSLTVFRLKPGATIANTLDDLTAEATAQGPQAAEATRRLNQDATFVGGVDITPGATLTSTSDHLAPGSYYLTDPSAAYAPGGHLSVLETLRLEPGPDRDTFRPSTARITMTKEDRFRLTGRLKADGTVAIDNDVNTIHLVDLVPVATGTTDSQLQAFFDSFGPTGPTLPDPETGPGIGESIVSPHTSQTLRYHLPAGDYALECFIADDITGMPHAFMGMHYIVHID